MIIFVSLFMMGKSQKVEDIGELDLAMTVYYYYLGPLCWECPFTLGLYTPPSVY
jgi:hypothetical protein